MGLIMLAVLGFVGSLHQATYEKTSSLILETNITTAAQMIESDFNKIGNNAPKPAFIRADSNACYFLSDLDNSGVVKTVKYSLAPLSESESDSASDSTNGLSRTVSGSSPIVANLQVSDLKFAYLDTSGAVTTNVPAIKAVNVRITLQNAGRATTAAKTLFWSETFYIRN